MAWIDSPGDLANNPILVLPLDSHQETAMPSAITGYELPPPTFPHIGPHGIGVHTAAHLAARIRSCPLMSAGDLLEVFWGNRFVAARVLPATAGSIDVEVPAALLHNGVNRCHYRLLKAGQCPRRSLPASVRVKLDIPGDGALAPIVLPTRIARDGIDLNTLQRHLKLSIRPYANRASGDRITVRWGDVRVDLAPLENARDSSRIAAYIPREVIFEAGPDPFLDVSYCILDQVGNCSGWAPSMHIPIS